MSPTYYILRNAVGQQPKIIFVLIYNTIKSNIFFIVQNYQGVDKKLCATHKTPKIKTSFCGFSLRFLRAFGGCYLMRELPLAFAQRCVAEHIGALFGSFNDTLLTPPFSDVLVVSADEHIGYAHAAPYLRLSVLGVLEQTVIVALELKALVVAEHARL